ncbi:MAG: hypothetical protein IJ058_07745 [Lachnospiraceae bacterium]|nr:hypothetical protein [Lachnospiraceae bacterium]
MKLFSPVYEITGIENIPGEGCVIVGNHSHMYGPIASELYAPGEHYTWCAGEMMHASDVADYAYRDFWSGKPKAVRWFYRLLSYAITPLAVCIFNNAHTIGVYHDSRILNTFRESVNLLSGGANVVIFPEHNVPYNNIVYEFQDKFIDLARTYRQKNDRNLAFVPMYISPGLKKIIYGKPVYYTQDAPGREERARVSRELMESITSMAVSLPEHTVIPYPNMAAGNYPSSLPLEYYNEKTES